MRILLVDDDTYQLRNYRNFISNLGHEVIDVDLPMAAWNLLREEEFDAFVSDVQMPIMSGFELAQRLRHLRQKIPTLLHSSETRHSTGKEWIDLTVIHEDFKFVTFHQKQFNVDPSYIRDFLEKVAQERPGA